MDSPNLPAPGWYDGTKVKSTIWGTQDNFSLLVDNRLKSPCAINILTLMANLNVPKLQWNQIPSIFSTQSKGRSPPFARRRYILISSKADFYALIRL